MRSHRGDLRLSNPDWNEYELLGGIRWLRAMLAASCGAREAGTKVQGHGLRATFASIAEELVSSAPLTRMMNHVAAGDGARRSFGQDGRPWLTSWKRRRGGGDTDVHVRLLRALPLPIRLARNQPSALARRIGVARVHQDPASCGRSRQAGFERSVRGRQCA